MKTPLEKTCLACGRTMQWRKKWAHNWEAVKYCSNACRKNKPGRLDARLEKAILDLLESRKKGATICPGEAARVVEPYASQEWHQLMELTRRAARRLTEKNQIEITQGGRVVDPSLAKGPIRLRLKTNGS